MRICAVSDTHLYRPDLPKGDLLIHAGDICSSGMRPQEFISEIAWLGRQDFETIVYVPGNHDRWVEANPGIANEICEERNVTMLIDQNMLVGDLYLYGSPWTPKFMNWAFMLDDDKQAEECWEKIPYDLDILITHGPPRGLFDNSPDGHVGCEVLRRVVEIRKPKLHLFGHIHEDGLKYSYNDSTFSANLSVLDGRYRPWKETIFRCEVSQDGVVIAVTD